MQRCMQYVSHARITYIRAHLALYAATVFVFNQYAVSLIPLVFILSG